jgi:hypothetical protein
MVGLDYSMVVSFELALIIVCYLAMHGDPLTDFLLAYWCGYLTDLDRPLAYGFYTVIYLFIFLTIRWISDKFRIQTMGPTLTLIIGVSLFEQCVSFLYYWLTPWTHISLNIFMGMILSKIILNAFTTLLIFPLFQIIDAIFTDKKSILPF